MSLLTVFLLTRVIVPSYHMILFALYTAICQRFSAVLVSLSAMTAKELESSFSDD